MKAAARKIVDLKTVREDGSIVQIKVWKLPAATAERPHGLKYTLFYGRPGERIVGYDNEAGKGDHRHYRDREEPYRFTSYETLFSDFWRDVDEDGKEKDDDRCDVEG